MRWRLQKSVLKRNHNSHVMLDLGLTARNGYLFWIGGIIRDEVDYCVNIGVHWEDKRTRVQGIHGT
jgi:hypothetical protein